MTDYLRVVASGYRFLVPRDMLAEVRLINAGLKPAPVRRRTPDLLVDANRLLCVPPNDGRKTRSRIILNMASVPLSLIVDRAERIESHEEAAFRPLPRSLAFVARNIDGVLPEGDGPLLLRLRRPDGSGGLRLARLLRKAAVELTCDETRGEGSGACMA